MSTQIPIPFFGRTNELAELEARCANPGITVVTGPPRIGKTRLLQEFVKRSRAADSRCIGMGQGAEAAGDVILRACKDAYAHWLASASGLEQLRATYAALKKDGSLVTRVGIELHPNVENRRALVSVA